MKDFPKIVAMYMVKNEERFIKYSLDSIRDICSDIVIVDDGSTDDTRRICESFDNVELYHQENIPFDEPRDRNRLLKMALMKKPEYILYMDGDELLLPFSSDILLEDLNVLYPTHDIFEIQSLEIWDKPNHYRSDGLCGNTWRPRIMKLKNQPEDLCFSKTPYPQSLHTPGLPQNGIGFEKPARSRIKIIHYGNFDSKLRRKKFERYNEIDPNNISFDGYKHLISGDGRMSGSEGIKLQKLPDFITSLLPKI